MRKAFIQIGSRYRASKLAPWASAMARCEEGFVAFESREAYKTWKKQK